MFAKCSIASIASFLKAQVTGGCDPVVRTFAPVHLCACMHVCTNSGQNWKLPNKMCRCIWGIGYGDPGDTESTDVESMTQRNRKSYSF